MGSSLCIFIAQEQVAPDDLRSFVLGLGGSGDENPKISHLLYSKNGYVMIFLEAEFISVLKEDSPDAFQDVCSALDSHPQSVITIDPSGHNESYSLAFSFAYACMKRWSSSIVYFDESDPVILTQPMIADIIQNRAAIHGYSVLLN